MLRRCSPSIPLNDDEGVGKLAAAKEQRRQEQFTQVYFKLRKRVQLVCVCW